MRHGGKVVVDHLRANGVERVFSVPGESFLAILDGLHGSGIANIVCRHEGAAAMMAEATGKLTGRPGIALVTRGPGATNAAAGIHVASHDSTPMILLVGQISRGHRDRGAFQEVDYRAFFGGLAKWVAEVDDTARLPEYLSRAFHVAVSGRPGPVVLSLPEDVLTAGVEVADIAPPAPAVAAGVPVEAITGALGRAQRPLVVVGGSRWSAQAAADLASFVSAWDIPVAASFRRQGHFDNRVSHYAGDLGAGMNPALGRRLAQCDLLVALGCRISDMMTAGYSLIAPERQLPSLVHVHPDPDEPGRVFRPDAAITADPVAVAAALARTAPAAPCPWREWTRAARAGYEDWTLPRRTPGAVRLEEVIAWLSDNLPEDAIVTNGAGNYAAFLHRYFRYKGWGTQLAPTSGSMGYGFPAAVAASLAHPGRTVVCLAGDGCFQMTLNEMSTAMQHGAHPVVIVANNGIYGTIRMHQERHYPGRVSGTTMATPDFAALARAYGAYGERVGETSAFAGAFARARGSGRLAVIELALDPEAVSTGATLSAIRAAAGGGEPSPV